MASMNRTGSTKGISNSRQPLKQNHQQTRSFKYDKNNETRAADKSTFVLMMKVKNSSDSSSLEELQLTKSVHQNRSRR